MPKHTKVKTRKMQRKAEILYRSGVEVEDIAKKLEVNQTTVRRWIRNNFDSPPNTEDILEYYLKGLIDIFESSKLNGKEGVAVQAVLATLRLIQFREAIGTQELTAGIIDVETIEPAKSIDNLSSDEVTEELQKIFDGVDA